MNSNALISMINVVISYRDSFNSISSCGAVVVSNRPSTTAVKVCTFPDLHIYHIKISLIQLEIKSCFMADVGLSEIMFITELGAAQNFLHFCNFFIDK